jgi:hypothetical protein
MLGIVLWVMDLILIILAIYLVKIDLMNSMKKLSKENKDKIKYIHYSLIKIVPSNLN